MSENHHLYETLCSSASQKSAENIAGKLSIHSQTAIDFYKSIGANNHVLAILESGLKLPFSSYPLPYYEGNNASASVHSTFLYKKWWIGRQLDTAIGFLISHM